jgi:hypothetical protein
MRVRVAVAHMMKLSAKPKPTKGIPLASANVSSCLPVGCATASATLLLLPLPLPLLLLLAAALPMLPPVPEELVLLH